MRKLLSMVLIMTLVFSLFSVNAFAAKTTPSIEQKGAPAVVSAKIIDKDGNLVSEIPFGAILITPISSKDLNGEEIRALLESAWKQVQEAATILDLCKDAEKYIPEGLTAEDLVISDLFDVSLTGEYADYLSEDGNSISVTFDVGYVPVMVLHNIEGTTWEVIPEEDITVSGTTVVVTLNSLSVIAFVKEKSDTAGSADEEESPQTGESSLPLIAGIFLLVAGAGCIALRKRA